MCDVDAEETVALPGVPTDEVPEVPEVPVLPTLTADQSKLIDLIKEIVTKKPSTRSEALKLFHELNLKLGTWLVSELPALEAKATLVALWAVQEVETLAGSCFPWK